VNTKSSILTVAGFRFVCVCVVGGLSVGACARVCVLERIYVCACVRVCLTSICMGSKDKQLLVSAERVHVCVCVCVCACMCVCGSVFVHVGARVCI
jgi:hypothetical protein